MRRYMLDTNICSYAIKQRPETLRGRFNRLAEQLCISTITLSELVYGAEKSSKTAENLAVLEQFTAAVDVVPFDGRAAFHAGEIRARLQANGEQIGSYDLLIGAHARSQSLVLVTNNIHEFQRIDGLRLEHWT